jgi:hypothetical protein
MPSYDLVEPVEEPRRMRCSQHAPEWAGKPKLGKQRHAPSAVAGDRRPITEHEPPTFVPRLLGHGGEQDAGLLTGERKQRQLAASIEPGDDPRRPAADLSAAGVEKHRTEKAGAGRRRRVHVARSMSSTL